MKRGILTLCALVFAVISCRDNDDINLFEKSGDERTAEAIANLKDKLTDPANGWHLKYYPVEGSGSFHLLMKFNEDNTVSIQSDVAGEDGVYFNQTNTYRIDSSLGLELIIESYSAFSYLFETDQATFLAEYEFNYVEENPEGALVFKSKTDPSNPTSIVLEPANADDINLLGQDAASKLDSMANDFDKFSSSQQLTFADRDLSFDVSMNHTTRVIDFKAVSRISDRNQNTTMDFSTGYLIEGNTIIFSNPLTGSFLGNDITLAHMQVLSLLENTLDLCGEPHKINGISGLTSQGETVQLESSFLDIAGKNLPMAGSEFWAPLEYIFTPEGSLVDQITSSIQGVSDMRFFYGYDLGGGEVLNALGFLVLDENDDATFALWEFTPLMEDNRIILDFADEVSIFGEAAVNTDAIKQYVSQLTAGDNVYVFKYSDDIYELHNPCTKWSVAFIRIQRD